MTLSAIQRGQERTWEGRIVRSEGVVDENTRVTYAVARIEDPYRMQAEDNGVVPLPMGTFVAASIDGATVDGVVRVPRGALRGNGQLVIVDAENRLEIRNVRKLRADSAYAYLIGGVEPGERISLTVIENPINGMRVRTEDDPGRTASRHRDQDRDRDGAGTMNPRGVTDLKGIIAWFASNHVAANLLMLLIVAFGVVSSFSIRKQTTPDFRVAQYPGPGAVSRCRATGSGRGRRHKDRGGDPGHRRYRQDQLHAPPKVSAPSPPRSPPAKTSTRS